MLKILVAEDEKAISDLIKMSLRRAGYCCDAVYDGEAAADSAKNGYDLILLDIMLPKADGFEVMEYIKPLGIPVIFITAKSAVKDRVKGLRMGADDYIVKPFEIVELLARVDAVLRRYNKTSDIIKTAGLEINLSSMLVTRNGVQIKLAPKEFELLVLFARNPNIALYRETIYERVWGEDFPYGSKTVDVHIQRLRKKAGLEGCLKAVNKVGYRLETENRP